VAQGAAQRADLAALGRDLLLLQIHHALHGIEPFEDRRVVGECGCGEGGQSRAAEQKNRQSHLNAPPG
jgi:hypothetical protein